MEILRSRRTNRELFFLILISRANVFYLFLAKQIEKRENLRILCIDFLSSVLLNYYTGSIFKTSFRNFISNENSVRGNYSEIMSMSQVRDSRQQ